MIGRYLSLMAVRAALRLAARLARAAAIVLLVVAAAPVSLVAALAVTLAWLGGWPPRRLYRAALACLPMVAVWLVAVANAGRSVPHAAAAPYQAWLAAWHQLAAGSPALAATTIAPVAIPLGLAVGGLIWSRRIYAMETGAVRSRRASGGARYARPGPGSPRPAPVPGPPGSRSRRSW